MEYLSSKNRSIHCLGEAKNKGQGKTNQHSLVKSKKSDDNDAEAENSSLPSMM